MSISRHIIAQKRPPATVKCLHCSNDFTRRHSMIFNKVGDQTMKYCSVSCATKHRNPVPYFECATCRNTVSRRKSNHAYDYKQIYCSRACQHKSLDKGGTIDKNGYRIIHVDGQPVAEHRYVMEKKIGRKLFSDETVHHKDGQRSFNDPSNLELWSSRQPKGQRVEDKVSFALSILSRYRVPPEIFTASEAVRGLLAC